MSTTDTANTGDTRHRSRFSAPQYDDNKAGTFLRIADRFGVATAVLFFFGFALWGFASWCAVQFDWCKINLALPFVTQHVSLLKTLEVNVVKIGDNSERAAAAMQGLRHDAQKLHKQFYGLPSPDHAAAEEKSGSGSGEANQ